VPQVWISVTAVGRTKTGRHRIEYVVHDERGWYLDQSLGYTRSPGRSIDPDAAVLDPAVQEHYAKEAEQRRKERREKEDPRKRERRAVSLLKAKLADLSVDGRRELLTSFESWLEAETDA
jgi:hypothetical protein